MPIRSALPDDIPALKAIARNVIRHNYTSFLGTEATAAFIDSGMSDKEIEDGMESCAVLEEKGKVIAFAVTKENLLHLIMVDTPFQNAGYGRALLLHVENELFTRYSSICLQTFQENTAAAIFYLTTGGIFAGRTVLS